MKTIVKIIIAFQIVLLAFAMYEVRGTELISVIGAISSVILAVSGVFSLSLYRIVEYFTEELDYIRHLVDIKGLPLDPNLENLPALIASKEQVEVLNNAWVIRSGDKTAYSMDGTSWFRVIPRREEIRLLSVLGTGESGTDVIIGIDRPWLNPMDVATIYDYNDNGYTVVIQEMLTSEDDNSEDGLTCKTPYYSYKCTLASGGRLPSEEALIGSYIHIDV